MIERELQQIILLSWEFLRNNIIRTRHIDYRIYLIYMHIET